VLQPCAFYAILSLSDSKPQPLCATQREDGPVSQGIVIAPKPAKKHWWYLRAYSIDRHGVLLKGTGRGLSGMVNTVGGTNAVTQDVGCGIHRDHVLNLLTTAFTLNAHDVPCIQMQPQQSLLSTGCL